MSESLGSAVLELSADSGSLTRTVAAAHASTVAQFKQTGKMSKAAMAAGMLAVGAAVGVGLYKVAEQFDEAFDNIRTRTGATGNELEGLKESFRGVFANVPDDAKTVGDALADVNVRLGLTGGQLEERTTQFLNLSRITGTDVKTNIEKVSKAFRDWEVNTEDQGKTLDGFFRLSQETGISVDDLAGRVQQFGSPLRQLGFTLGEAASMFSIFEAAGVNTATLMPGFKMAIGNVLKPTDDLKNGMKELGISLEDGPEAAVKKFITTLANSKDPMKLSGLAMDFFGKRAGADMVEAISQGRLNLEDMLDVFDNGGDTINGAAEDTMDFSEKLQMLKNRGMLALERPAMLVFDALTHLSNIVIALTDAFSSLPAGMRQAIVVTAGVAAGVIALAYAFGKAKIAFMALKVLMLANPYVLIIAATIAIAVLIYKNWNTIKGWLQAAWNWIKGAAETIWGALKSFFIKYWKLILVVFTGPLGLLVGFILSNWRKILEVGKTIWGAIKNSIMTIVRALRDVLRLYWTAIKTVAQTYWNLVKTVITTAVRVAVSIVKTVFGSLRDGLRAIWGAIRESASVIWNSIRQRIVEPIKGAIETVKNVVSSVASWLAEKWSAIAGRVSAFGSNMKSALVGAFKGAANAVIGFLNAIINAINKIPAVPNIKPIAKLAIGGTLSSAGGDNAIPGFAEGGKVTRPMAIVGEEAPRHPEYVIPTNPAYRGRAIALTAALIKELGLGGIPGYYDGGVIGGAARSLSSVANAVSGAVSGAVSLVTNGPGAILDLLPDPASMLPTFLKGTGKWIIEKITDWIKDKIDDLISSLIGSGGGGGSGMKTGALASILAQKFGLDITSGFRDPVANADANGATGSSHMKGTPENPGAHDFVPPTGSPGTPGAAGLYATSVLGAMWADNHDMGSGLHQHVSWFRKGGVLDRLSSSSFLGSYGGGGVLPADGLYYGHAGEHVGKPPVVNIQFADGMSWLRDFVEVSIDGADRKAEQVYIAGVVR